MINEKEYFKQIKDIENKYYSILSDLNTNFPKSTNLQQQKKKFFKYLADDRKYNPQFKFRKHEINEDKLNEFKQLKINTKDDLYGFKKLYKKRIKSKINEINCHKYWGKQVSTKYVKKYRGKPSRLLLSHAKVFCNNYKREKVRFRRISHKKVAQELKKAVKKLTGENIKIIYVNIPSKINIYPKGKTIKINPNVEFNTLDVKRLIAHEINVHYLRYYNGSKTGIKILETGTSNYIKTEEGLAVYNEKLNKVLSKAQLYIYAGRVIATYYALKKDFYEIFYILKSYGFEDEEAFTITYRAKRNISDTSQKGGFTKDYVYFAGYLKIKKYIKRKNIDDLLIGKISIRDLKTLKKYIKNKIDII